MKFSIKNVSTAGTALLLNEVSEKSREIWNEVFEIFSESRSEICSEVLSEIFRAFLAGRKVLLPNFTSFFPSEISNFKSNSKSNFTKIFTTHTSAGLAALREWFFHSEPLSGRRKTRPGIEIFNREWKSQTENENFKREWLFHAWGNVFSSFEREWIFSISAPSGHGEKNSVRKSQNATESAQKCLFFFLEKKEAGNRALYSF